MSLFGHSINTERKSIVLYFGERNFAGVTYANWTFREIFILIEKSFMYGLPDFSRKHNITLQGSKLTSYFKET